MIQHVSSPLCELELDIHHEPALQTLVEEHVCFLVCRNVAACREFSGQGFWFALARARRKHMCSIAGASDIPFAHFTDRGVVGGIIALVE